MTDQPTAAHSNAQYLGALLPYEVEEEIFGAISGGTSDNHDVLYLHTGRSLNTIHIRAVLSTYGTIFKPRTWYMVQREEPFPYDVDPISSVSPLLGGGGFPTPPNGDVIGWVTWAFYAGDLYLYPIFEDSFPGEVAMLSYVSFSFYLPFSPFETIPPVSSDF